MMYFNRVYLKRLNKLQEWVPHNKTKKTFILIYVHSFRGTAPRSSDLVTYDSYLWRHLKPLMYLSSIESEETQHNAFLCMSDRSQPPRDLCKGAIFHVWTCPCCIDL